MWIKNCVGYNNHRYFLLFLLMTTIYCFYGTYLCIQQFWIYADLLRPWFQSNGLKTMEILVALLRFRPWLGLITLFAPLAGIIVFGFLIYHLYLIFTGFTSKFR